MTRDQAIGVLVKNAAPCFPHMQESEMQPLCGAEVDAWVELGMLKLDEPKSVERKLDEIFTGGLMTRDYVMHSLEARGLKIVEK
jgi:hypothetical protein